MKLTLIALALSVTALPAATIQWGGSVWGTDLQSDGETPLDDSFDFQIGTFTDGFVPDSSNYSDWEVNWSAIATTTYNETNMFFAGQTQFLDENTSLPDIQFNGQTFVEGDQVYLWGYNSKVVAGGSEWTLVSNGTDWTVPAGTATQQTVPVSFRVSNADTPVVGDLPGAADGEGEYTPIGGDFDIQTASVPEPSTALLVLLGAFALLRRR